MTAFDRFDPFAGRVTSALEEIAPASRPAYLDAVLAQTARTSQRPRWTFIRRWLPMDTAIPRSSGLARVPVRMLFILLLLMLAIAAAVVWVGSRTRVPPPFGSRHMTLSNADHVSVRSARTDMACSSI